MLGGVASTRRSTIAPRCLRAESLRRSCRVREWDEAPCELGSLRSAVFAGSRVDVVSTKPERLTLFLLPNQGWHFKGCGSELNASTDRAPICRAIEASKTEVNDPADKADDL